jgi:hypothetical protein
MVCLFKGDEMPRRAPGQVVEQRHTLGTFERAQLGQMIQLKKRQQVIDGVAAGAVPLVVVAGGLTAVFMATQTWQKVRDLVPDFGGILDGASTIIHGDQATKEAILRDANQQAEQDGKPLSFWQKARNRFAFDAFRFGGGVY